MKKEAIQKLRIDILCEGKSALCMLMDRAGRVSRQGSGALPADPFAVMSEGDGSIFAALIGMLDEQVFAHAGVYDHPDKSGLPITYSVAFLGSSDDEVVAFEFRLGTRTADVGELLPYFDQFISKAVMATDEWYAREKAMADQQEAKG